MMSTPRRLLLFDLDGVLVAPHGYRRAFRLSLPEQPLHHLYKRPVVLSLQAECQSISVLLAFRNSA